MKKLGSSIVYDGWIKVHQDKFELDNGKAQTYDILRLGSGAGVLAFLDDRTVMLTKQYRPALDDTFLELIQGKCDDGEDSITAAHRELLEETGYKGSLDYLCHFKPLPSTLDADLSLYVATDLVKVQEQCLDETEQLVVVNMPFLQLYNEIKEGKHTDAALQLAVYSVILNYPNLTSTL